MSCAPNTSRSLHLTFSLLRLALPFVMSCFAAAQQPEAAPSSVVPPLVSFSGKAVDLQGKPMSGVLGATFSIYKDESEGAPLWMETQNVTADSKGNYTVHLGATMAAGLPLDVFTSGEARWLGVRINGGEEQPRVLLLSVPYALKAADAQTLGGLPASAFLLAAQAAGTSSTSSADTSSSSSSAAPAAVGGSGMADYVPLWTNGNTLGDSVLYQSGTGSTAKIGINTKTPSATLDVKGGANIQGTLSLPTTGAATATAGKSSQPQKLTASSYNSSTKTAVNENFQWQAEPAGNNTASPDGTLNLLYGSGSNTPSETGLNIAGNGQITFATGQTFPGTGTITGVTAGTGLTGGGNSGNVTLSMLTSCASGQVLQWNGSQWVCSNAATGTITGVTAGTDLIGGGTAGNVTLNLDTSKVPQLNAANTFIGNQTVNGNLGATSFAGDGSALTNLQGANVQGTVASAINAQNLGGLPPSSYQPAGSYATTGPNSFTGDQSVNGNVSATGSISGAAGNFTGMVTEAGALLPASGTASPSQGYNSQPLDAVASVYDSNAAQAQSADFRWQAEPAGNDTGAPSGTLSLLYGLNGAMPTETGLSIASNGRIAFTAGQTFPGVGTVTSVGSGAGLTGGPITGSGALSIANGGVTNSMLQNSSVTVTAGTDLTGGGAVTLGGSTTLNLDTAKVPQLSTANTFIGDQSVNGSLSASGNITANNLAANLNVSGGTGTFSGLVSAGNLSLGNALTVANGGTGLSGGTSGGILSFTASGALASSDVLIAGALVLGGGTGAVPSTSADFTTASATNSATLKLGKPGDGNDSKSGDLGALFSQPVRPAAEQRWPRRQSAAT